jgi:iron complex outermembrane receptor protein
MTQDMIDFIRAPQVDSSEQKLELISANLTGDLFDIGDRPAGFAVGVEHRRYDASFSPDPLRQSGESQDSQAFPVSADYDVSEIYAEFNFPVLASLDVSAAVRYSDYSTFGGETTGKLGFRWQPIGDLALRGTYSTGFRAPNLGELYGLTQFGATLVDPCGPTGDVVVDDDDGPNTTPLETACRAQGVPSGFEQANTQITTFTGGNPDVEPETSDSYTLGLQYRPSWAEDMAGTEGLAFELTYYHHKIDGAIQASDIQALLDACLAAGGEDETLCEPFTRQTSGNLNPPNNQIDNLANIETDGVDIKIDWSGLPVDWGQFVASLQATYVNDYKAVDSLGFVSQRRVGIEVSDSAIPEWQANLRLGWNLGSWEATWTLRYIDEVKESCGNATVVGVPGCETRDDWNSLDSTVYNDAQVAWADAFKLTGLRLTLGINNIFGEDPPVCYTCSLNGYDAGTYDLPGRFWNVAAKYKF